MLFHGIESQKRTTNVFESKVKNSAGSLRTVKDKNCRKNYLLQCHITALKHIHQTQGLWALTFPPHTHHFFVDNRAKS